MFGHYSALSHFAANKQINQDKKQLAAARTSRIIANYLFAHYLGVIWLGKFCEN
jgi:hypothetical protein